MFSMLRGQLFALKQLPTETVGAYLSRADTIYCKLLSSGGKLSSSSYLQCVKEGVLNQFRIVIQFFEQKEEKSKKLSVLAGMLLDEECSTTRRNTLGTAGTSAGNTAMTIQELVKEVLLVMQPNGTNQPWTAGGRAPPKNKTGPPPPPPASSASQAGRAEWHTLTQAQKDARNTADITTALCWNCGKTGHRLGTCPIPLTKPFKFKPADWMPSALRRQTRPPAVPGVVA
jgi:hypothetical protein